MTASTHAPLDAPYSGRVAIEITTVTGQGQRYPDTTLRVVNKSDKGADVALLLVGALLGSFRLPMAKEDYRGTNVESLRHPVSGEFMGGLAKAVDSWHAERGRDTKYKNPLLMRADNFSLIYGDFDDETPRYDLYLETAVWRKADSAGWFSTPVYLKCANQYAESKLTLEQWAADDYALVKARCAEHTSSCIKKLQTSFDELFQE